MTQPGIKPRVCCVFRLFSLQRAGAHHRYESVLKSPSFGSCIWEGCDRQFKYIANCTNRYIYTCACWDGSARNSERTRFSFSPLKVWCQQNETRSTRHLANTLSNTVWLSCGFDSEQLSELGDTIIAHRTLSTVGKTTDAAHPLSRHHAEVSIHCITVSRLPVRFRVVRWFRICGFQTIGFRSRSFK
jgi:hypothetical protein